MTINALTSLVDLNPADLEFTPVKCSHGRTFYRDNLMSLLHGSPAEGIARYSWTAEKVLAHLAHLNVAGLADALARVTGEGWRPTGIQYDSNARLSINLKHLGSRWGIQVGVNLDRYADTVLVLRSSGMDNPPCSWSA